jgi:hypothetical protein
VPSSLARARRLRRRRVAAWAAFALTAAVGVSLYLTGTAGHVATAARDGTDPYADGCTADKKAITTMPVRWPGGRTYGTIILYYSPACQAAWGYLNGPNSTAWTIHIIAERPSSHVAAPWQFSGNTEAGSWSNVLSTRPGCVSIAAFVTTHTATGPRTVTPCFTGSGPVIDDGEAH